MIIKFEEDYSKHYDIASDILRTLPEWFGIESSIVDYCNASRNLPMVVIYSNHKPIGFCTIKIEHAVNCNLNVLGILPEFHGLGYGTKLIEFIETYCKSKGIHFMSVLTLSSKSTNEPYKRTREFYTKCGFKEFMDLDELWDDNNPCILMLKKL